MAQSPSALECPPLAPVQVLWASRSSKCSLIPAIWPLRLKGSFALCQLESARVSQTINLRPLPCAASCLPLTRPGDLVSSLLNEKRPPGLSPSYHSNLAAGHGAPQFAWRVPTCHLTGRCAVTWGVRRGGRCRAQGHLTPGHSKSLPAQRNLLWTAASRFMGDSR